MEMYSQEEIENFRMIFVMFDPEHSGFVGVKDLVLSFRERLGIQKEIHNLLFDEMKHNEAMYKVKFYNQVKKIITRSSGLDNCINIRIFTSLI